MTDCCCYKFVVKMKESSGGFVALQSSLAEGVAAAGLRLSSNHKKMIRFVCATLTVAYTLMTRPEF